MMRALLALLTLSLFADRAAAQAPSGAQATTTVRAPDDPSVSPPLSVDPSSLSGLHQHALLQQKVGFYAVLLPPDYDAPANRNKRYPVALILHGGASSEIRHGKLADAFGRKGIIYVVPRAANANEPVILSEKRIAWSAQPTYPSSWGAASDAHFPKAEVEALDVPGIHLSWIADALADARKRYRIADGKALVIGHSQGGTFAHLLAIRKPELVKSYFAYAGNFEAVLANAEQLKKHRIRPYLAHHQNDERVPVKQSEALAAYFKSHGVDHSLLILPGGDHMLDKDVHAAVRTFLREQAGVK